MKKLIIVLTILGFSITETIAQTEFGSWSNNTCYQGLSFRVKSFGYIQSVNKYSYLAEIKNNYSRKVTFDMSWEVAGEKQGIGQFTLSPGAVTHAATYYFTANANIMDVSIGSVCFADASAGGCGIYGMCFAACDNGSPNIPTNCGGATSNTKSQVSGSNNNSNNANNTLQNGTSKRVLNEAECAKYFPNGHPSDCIWASCPCPHVGETYTNTSGSNTSPQQNQSVALTLLQDQQLVSQTISSLGDLFESIRSRKEEQRKQRDADLTEKTKRDAFETIFNTKELETYLQYILNELLQENTYSFKDLENYWINEWSRSVLLIFDKFSINFSYDYQQNMKSSGNVKNGLNLVVVSSVSRTASINFKTKDLMDNFRQSAIFNVLKKYSKENKYYTPNDSCYDFYNIDLNENKAFKSFSNQWLATTYPVDVNRLMTAMVQRAEGPIDTTAKLLYVLKQRGKTYDRGGYGVKEDKKISAYYFEKAAQLGDISSMLSLYNIYKNYDELKDLAKANYWLEQACILGKPDNYSCKELEKVTGRKIQSTNTSITTANIATTAPNNTTTNPTANITALKNHSEWEEVNTPGNRFIIYISNDSLVTSKAGLLGYSCYKKTSPGIYEWDQNHSGGRNYRFKLTGNTAVQEIYKDGAASELFDFKVLSNILTIIEPVLSSEPHPLTQLAGEWFCENHKDKKLILSQANSGEMQLKLTGFEAILLKEVSLNKYEFNNGNLKIKASVINGSKLQMNFQYKDIGMTTVGYYNR